MMTIGQAMRNAIEVEKAAARYYGKLVERAAGKRTRLLLQELMEQEEAHAQAIEEMGARIESGSLPLSADDRIESVETAPGWGESGAMELAEALELALEAENNAALYYDAMADSFTGEVSDFFRRLTEIEQRHARMLSELLEELRGRSA